MACYWIKFIDIEVSTTLKKIFKKGIIWLSFGFEISNIVECFLELLRKIMKKCLSMNQFRALYPFQFLIFNYI